MRKCWVVGLAGLPVLAWAQAPIAGNLTPVPMATLAGQVTRQIASGGFANVPLDQATVAGLSLTSTIGALVPRSSVGQPNGPAQLGPDGSLGLVPLGGGRTGSQANAQINANAAGITGEIARATGAEGLLIPKAAIGAASGVAGLDANGNAVAPVLAPSLTSAGAFQVSPSAGSAWSTTLANSVQVGGYSIARGNNEVLATYGNGQQVMDWASAPEQLRLGGSVEYDSVPVNEHCFPYGAGNMGTCAQFMLGSQNIQGQAAGVGPGGAGQIPNYDNFDVANLVTQAQGATPIFTATSNHATNVMPVPTDGLDHTPTFTANGATFANPLPASASAWITAHPQVRVMTNWIGCVACAIQTYVGVEQSATTNAAGLVTGITVDGWRVFESGDTASGQIPGQTTTDGSSPALDTTWTAFGYPALMFGVYTKAFNHYSLCSTYGPSPTSAPGDINYPTGDRNQQLRNCEAWEADLLNGDPTGKSVLHGITVPFSKLPGAANQPAPGSYDFYGAGANLVAYQASGEYFTQPFSSQSFRASGYNGPAYAAGSTNVMADWTECDRTGYECDGGWPRHTVRATLWDTRNVTAADSPATGQDDPGNSWGHITVNLGVQIDGNTTQGVTPALDGTVQEHIELNPASNANGIGLCAYGQTDASCGLVVTGTGGTILNDGVTFKTANPAITSTPGTSNGTQPLVNLGRFPVSSQLAPISDPFQSPDALYVGGLPTQGWSSSGLANNPSGRPGSLVVSGQPWGPYNAGALESILWGTGVDQQNGIANVDWRTGLAPPFDGVAQYVGVNNDLAMIVAPAQFAAGQVTISPALTQAQLGQLRVGMYVSTNIINAQVSTQGVSDWIGTGYPIANFYQGVISGWSQSTNAQGQPVTVITVPAWDSYSFANHNSADVPGNMPGDSIDTVRSKYGAPMVFIGNDVGEAAHNDFITYHGDESSTAANNGHATALSHAMGDSEVDFRYYATKPNDVTYTGITMSTQPIGNSPVGSQALTSNSYFLNLSGDMPNLLVLDGAANNNIIQSHSFYLHGQEGTFFPQGSTAGQSGMRQVQTNFAFTSYADSQNAMNLVSYQQAYGTGSGYANTSYHFGLHTDGNFMQPTTSGYNQGEIEWNPQGTAPGSIGLCANGENCGILVNGNGAAVVPNGLTFPSPSSNGVSTYTTEDNAANLSFHASNGAGSYANLFAATFNATAGVVAPSVATSSGVGPAYPTFSFANLPTSGLVDGQHARCSDCKLNSHTGVDAVWNAGASQWTDMMDNALSH